MVVPGERRTLRLVKPLEIPSSSQQSVHRMAPRAAIIRNGAASVRVCLRTGALHTTRAPLARPVQTVPPLQLKAEESLWVIERELPLASRSGLRAIKEAARREEEWFLEEVQRK